MRYCQAVVQHEANFTLAATVLHAGTMCVVYVQDVCSNVACMRAARVQDFCKGVLCGCVSLSVCVSVCPTFSILLHRAFRHQMRGTVGVKKNLPVS